MNWRETSRNRHEQKKVIEEATVHLHLIVLNEI